MAEGFTETRASEQSRKIIDDLVTKGHWDKRLLDLKFEDRRRQRLSDKSGKLDLDRLHQSLGDYPESELLKKCIELNLTDKELLDYIEFRYQFYYFDPKEWPNRDSAKQIVSGQYPKFCENWGVKPRQEFIDSCP